MQQEGFSRPPDRYIGVWRKLQKKNENISKEKKIKLSNQDLIKKMLIKFISKHVIHFMNIIPYVEFYA